MKLKKSIIFYLIFALFAVIHAQEEAEDTLPVIDTMTIVPDSSMYWAKSEAYSGMECYIAIDRFQVSQYELLHPKDLLQVVSWSPGVDAFRVDNLGHNIIPSSLLSPFRGYYATPWIRGIENLGLLIDGIPLRSPYYGLHNVSLYNYFPVKNIEIIKGPYSAVSGSDALGGAINLVSKDGYMDKPYTRLTIDGGELGFEQLGVEFNQKFSRWFSYYLSLSKVSSQGHRENAKYKNEEFSLVFNSEPMTKLHAKGGLFINQSYCDLPGYDEALYFVCTNYYENYQGKQKYRDLFAYLRLFANLTDKLRLTAYLNYQMMDSKFNLYSSRISTYQVDTALVIDSVEVDTTIEVDDTLLFYSEDDDNESKIHLAGITLKWINFIPKNDLELGIHFENTFAKSSEMETQTLNQLAFEIEDVINLMDNFSIIARSRFDYDNREKVHISPLIGITYNTAKWRYFANYRTGYKNPNLYQLYWKDTEETTEHYGNEDLESIQDYCAEIGVYSIENPLYHKLTLYYGKMKDLIIPQDSYSLTNYHTVEYFGIETSLRYQYRKYLLAGFSYSYNSYLRDESEVVDHPEHIIKAFVQPQISFWNNNLKLSMRLEEEVYNGLSEPNIYWSDYYLPEPENGTLTIGNLHFLIKFHDLGLFLTIENLYDLDYCYRIFHSMPGRYIRFGGSWRFYY